MDNRKRCDYEILEYVVYYGEGKMKTFVSEENAIEFGKEEMNKGHDVDIVQKVLLIGWY